MMRSRSSKRLPAYGRELLAAQKAGRNVPWLLIALDWDLGRAMPRVVVSRDTPVDDWDLCLVRGLDCMIAHRGEQKRAIELADQALRSGARICPVFDAGLGRLEATA
jgi:hypothetical protein